MSIYIYRERERENKIKGATEGVKTFINSWWAEMGWDF